MKTILLLSMFCFGQDPDLSTPEKSCSAFAKTWLTSRHEMRNAFWTQIIPTIEKQGDFLFSERKKEELQQRRESHIKRAEKRMVHNRTIKRGPAQKNEDGSVSVEVMETYENGPAGGKTKKENRKHLFTFVKIGEEWKARDLYEPCRWCDSTGKCRSCERQSKGGNLCDSCKVGKPCGKCEEPGDCYSCKGSKTCKRCEGNGVAKMSLGEERGPSLDPIAPKKRTFSPDLSTPEATVRSYVDWKLHGASLLSEALLKVMRENIETLEPFLHSDVVAEMKSLNEEQTRTAKEAFPKKEKRFHIGPVKMEDEKAYVIVELRRDENGRGRQEQNRLVITKENNTWLISAVQSGCRSCDNTGVCHSCGKGDPCSACDGTKKCNKCEGKGWD